MRIGLYGGTFDPVHYGHLVLAEACREACRLDEVWFVPAQISPHKLDAKTSPPAQRIDMLEFALAGLPEFRISRIEVDRPGPSYTVDTLERLTRERPADEWFLFLGADSVVDFSLWRSPSRIAELATLVIVNRGRTPAPLDAIRSLVSAERPPLEVMMPGIDISATDIRRRAATGRSIRFLVPRAVEHYIREKRLYHPSEPSGA